MSDVVKNVSKSNAVLDHVQHDVTQLKKHARAVGIHLKKNKEALQEHEDNNVRRVIELHERINDTREELTQFRTETRLSNKRHDEKLDVLNDTIKPVIETHQTLAGLPKLIKWIALVIGGIVTIVGGIVTILGYLSFIAKG